MTERSPNPYSDAMIAALCDDLGISLDLAPKLRQGLRTAAHQWQRHVSDPVESVTPKNLTNSLLDLSAALDVAKGALEGVTDAQWEMIRHGSAVSNFDPYISEIGQRADAHDPAEEIRTVSLNHTDFALPDIIAALDVLASAAQLATGPIGKLKRGPQPNFPLKAWTRSMLFLCKATLGAPFTRDETQGQPVSRATIFCVKAFEVLSPETPKTLILSAMKGAIAEQAKTSEELNAKSD